MVVSEADQRLMASFGSPSRSMQNYIRNTQQQAAQILGSAGAHVMERIHNIYNEFTYGTVAKNIEAFQSTASHIFDVNVISKIEYIDDIQQANETTKELVMCIPEYADLYEQQILEGYDSTYIQPCSGRGDTNWTWRKFTNGVGFEQTKEDAKGNDVNYTEFKVFIESVKPDKVFTDIERARHKISIDSARAILENAETDPTSVDDAPL